MKLLKIFSLLLVGGLFATSCSDDDFNTNTATVRMTNSTAEWKETANLVYVPLSIEGEINGPVRVTVEVKEEGENPAKSDVHYLLTSNTYIFGEDDKDGGIEIKLIDDAEINTTRTFSVSLVKAEGASISVENAKTIVSVKDNDSNFYEKFAGLWTISGSDTKGAGISFPVNIITANEGDKDYEKVMYMTGYMGYEWTTIPLRYHFDISSKKGNLDIMLGNLMCDGVDFGLGGVNEVILGQILPEGKLDIKGVIEGSFDSNCTKVVYNSEQKLVGLIFAGNDFTGYTWFTHTGLQLTKK